MGNIQITYENIDKVVEKFNNGYLFMPKDFNINTVVKFKNESWNWKKICRDRKLMEGMTKDHLEAFLDKPLDWDYLSGYHIKYEKYIFVIPMEIIAQFPNKDWNFHKLTYQFFDINNRPNIKYVEQTSEMNWNWQLLSWCVSPEFISKFPNKDWNWKYISEIKSLQPEFVIKNLEKLGKTDNILNILERHEKRSALWKKYLPDIETRDVVPSAPYMSDDETCKVVNSPPLQSDQIEGS